MEKNDQKGGKEGNPSSKARPKQEKDIEDVLTPIIKLSEYQTEEITKQQEALLEKLSEINNELIGIKRNHYGTYDKKIDECLDKVEGQFERIENLKGNLAGLQKRVQKVEKKYQKMKKEIPVLEEFAKKNGQAMAAGE